MREVPGVMTAAWASGLYFGDSRPIARVTIHKPMMRLTRTSENLFASMPFGRMEQPKELPNVRSVEWSRDVDTDAASCTITFWNTAPMPIGETPVPAPDELDQAGYYTYNRGSSTYASRWKHSENEWHGMLMPDNVITTFEGYGFDANYVPEVDPFLVQTGEWMIDDVNYGADGLITVTCRDYGRMLHDQIAFPPVVPFTAGFVTPDLPGGAYSYPVSFAGVNSEPIITRTVSEETVQQPVAASTSRISMSYHDSSNTPYVGVNGAVYGHRGRDAFDEDPGTYWLSIGNARPDQGYSYEWIQGSIRSQTVTRVRFAVRGGPYTCFLSLYSNGQWVGTRMVPYDPNHPASAPNGADIPYLLSMRVTTTDWVEFDLPADGVPNVTRVRITFGGLWNSGLGTFPYRAAMRRMQAYTGTSGTEAVTRRVTSTHVRRFSDKNYDDYVDIVKLFLAWGGLYWPRTTSTGAQRMLSDGSQRAVNFPSNRDDSAMTIKEGRVWGDLRNSGTSGPAPLSATIFDKKPLIDCISYVRDILGYNFYIDEHGGAVFRPPNIYAIGNHVREADSPTGRRIANRIHTIDESMVLMSLNARISGQQLRERTFVSNANGTVGHMAEGWNPNPVGLRRVGGWTDQHFETTTECRVMAEMISLRQLMTYRTDEVEIPGYPAIQIDDQIRIYERVTAEGYIHYVKGIRSSLNMETGEYTYKLSTHWLGERPFSRWAFDPAQLSRETRRYLEGLYS